MLELVWDLIQKYNVTKVLVDASAPSFIRALKLAWGERPDYENVERELRDYMRVEPVSFGIEHKAFVSCQVSIREQIFADTSNNG